jgi:hypothetical protein
LSEEKLGIGTRMNDLGGGFVAWFKIQRVSNFSEGHVSALLQIYSKPGFFPRYNSTCLKSRTTSKAIDSPADDILSPY